MPIELLLFGIPAALIAASKGFKPWRWTVALGPLGLIAVLCLSSANEQGIRGQAAAARVAKANALGAWMCGLSLGVMGFCLLSLMSSMS